MKLVIFFADMLRANRLFVDDETSTRDGLEKLLESVGGTFFSNCITPGPDTPRSTGIFFTGELPKVSGVNARSKWPGPYLEPHKTTLFSWALNNKVPIKIIDEKIQHSGLFFPQEVQMKARFFPGLDSLRASEEPGDALELEIIFIVSMTYHKVVDDRSAHKSSHRLGAELIASELEEVVSDLQLGPGDQLILYSDHGCKLSDDRFDEYNLMDRDRSQFVFFHSQFTEPKVTFDNSLFSMVDLHAIISGLIKSLALTGRAGANGTLELPEAREMVHVEDHEDYSTKIGDVVRKWAVFSPDFEYFESLGKEPIIKLKVTNAQSALVNGVLKSQEYLKKYASGYADQNYQLHSLSQGFTKVSQEVMSSRAGHSNNSKNVRRFERLFWRLVTLPTSVVRRISPHIQAFSKRSSRVLSKSGSNQKLSA
jgi:hypothetical protein